VIECDLFVAGPGQQIREPVQVAHEDAVEVSFLLQPVEPGLGDPAEHGRQRDRCRGRVAQDLAQVAPGRQQPAHALDQHGALGLEVLVEPSTALGQPGRRLDVRDRGAVVAVVGEQAHGFDDDAVAGAELLHGSPCLRVRSWSIVRK
jgi:hypothetical protein